MKSFLWGIRNLFASAPGWGSLLVSLVAVQGFMPCVSIWVVTALVNSFSTSISFGVLGVWGLLLALQVASDPLVSLVRFQLNVRILARCNLLLMRKANSLQGLAAFEDKKLQDRINLLQQEARYKPLNFAFMTTYLLKEGVGLIGVLFILYSLHPILPLLVLLAALPHSVAAIWFEKRGWNYNLYRSGTMRRLGWLAAATLDRTRAAEIRLFGAGDFFEESYARDARGYSQEMTGKLQRQCWIAISIGMLSVAANLGLFFWAISSLLGSAPTAGAIVMLIQALFLAQGQVARTMQAVGMATQGVLFFAELRAFLREPERLITSPSVSTRNTGFREIVFDNVSLEYPNGQWGVRGLSLHIRAGERLALVGRNGAGKSTFVKLLLRLYDPTSGVIRVDGQNLQEIDPRHWREQISGAFQDFGAYHFSIAENIAMRSFAEPGELDRAAKLSGFASIAKKFSGGFDTQLGREFGGAGLSGGEEQRLALARALYRQAPLLVLDEPSAALDAEAEHALFEQLADLSSDQTLLFITHRMGSVRLADRILVMKDGRLVEEGAHETLMKIEREYFHLFSLQASRYGELVEAP